MAGQIGPSIATMKVAKNVSVIRRLVWLRTVGIDYLNKKR